MEKIIRSNTLKCFIAFISIFAFLIILRSVFKESIIEIDNKFYNHLAKYQNNIFTNFFKKVTLLGGVQFLIPCTLLLMILIKNKKYAICISANLAIIILINIILKAIIARPRPNDFNLIIETGYSFPSGHSMASTAFYGLLIYFIYTKLENKKAKFVSCFLLILLIVIIGLSRIYLRVHYLSDVLAGFCLTIAYLILYISIWKKYLYQKEEKKLNENT